MASGDTAPVPLGAPGNLTLFGWVEVSFDSAGNFLFEYPPVGDAHPRPIQRANAGAVCPLAPDRL